MLRCRGIRGAITVSSNTREEMFAATRELLGKLLQANGVPTEEIACIFFTTTTDLNADFPAAAAREMGLNSVPLLCAHEMNVPGSLPRCIRILLLVNTEKKPDEMVHLYLREAIRLRPGSLGGRTNDSNYEDRCPPG